MGSLAAALDLERFVGAIFDAAGSKRRDGALLAAPSRSMTNSLA
jgi:hypothetical protein